jgi:hypothetical protein
MDEKCTPVPDDSHKKRPEMVREIDDGWLIEGQNNLLCVQQHVVK